MSMFSGSCLDTLFQKRVFQILILFTVLFVIVTLGYDSFSLLFSFSSIQKLGSAEESNETLSPTISPSVQPSTERSESNEFDEDVDVEILLTQLEDFTHFVSSAFLDQRNYFCVMIEDAVEEFYLNKTNVTRLPKIHVTIEVSCLDVFMKSGWGTGNYILTLIMMRMAVRYMSMAQVKLNITCTDTEEFQWLLVLPWYTGVWYSSNYFNLTSALQVPNFEYIQGPLEPSLSDLPLIADDIVCGPAYNHPTGMMYEEVKYAARRMAVALIGVSLVGTDHLLSTKIHNFIEQYVYYHGDDNLKAILQNNLCTFLQEINKKDMLEVRNLCQ
jgi:hypothetical protein